MPALGRKPWSRGDRLLHFVGAIHESLDVGLLGRMYMEAVHALVPATGYGFYTLNRTTGRPTRIALRGTVERFVRCYEERGYECDPLLHHVSTTHEPTHDGMLFTDREWQRQPLRNALMMRRLVHIAEAPLVTEGDAAGMLTFTRRADEPHFSDYDLTTLALISRHTSIALNNALRHEEAQGRTAAAEAALDLIDEAVVLSSNECVITFANRPARALLDRAFAGRSGDWLAHFGEADELIMRSVPLPSTQSTVATFLYRRDDRAVLGHLGASLSDRETEVLLLVAQGLQNRQIADRLFISTNTVKFHLKRMYRTLRVSSRSELLARAYQSGPNGSPNGFETGRSTDPEHRRRAVG